MKRIIDLLIPRFLRSFAPRLELKAATDTNSIFYDSNGEDGLGFPGGPEWFYVFVDDEEGLDEATDKFRIAKIAKGMTVLDAFIQLGDHDANGTPAAKHDLGLNAAVNGNSAADFHLIDASTIGQAGGLARAGTGTSPDTSCLGRQIESNGAYLFLQTDTAPATAQTDDRKVLVGFLLASYPVSPIT